MANHLRRSIVLAIFFFLLLGLAYPLAGTGLAHLAFPAQSQGSLTPYGSKLIGQVWKGPGWFQGRPSATSGPNGKPDPYNAMASGAANLGPRSRQLVADVEEQAALLRREGISPTEDLVTSSGSGLDPDITPQAAYAEIPAVARARHLPRMLLDRLVAKEVRGPEFGFLGQPYVNVLELNLALEKLLVQEERAHGKLR